jgi:hypothetical protein
LESGDVVSTLDVSVVEEDSLPIDAVNGSIYGCSAVATLVEVVVVEEVSLLREDSHQ